MASTRSRARGYIEQRASGQWRAVVYAGVDPITGQEHRLRESAPTKKAAQAALSRLQTEVDEKRHPRTGVTMGELLDQWMEVSRHEQSTRDRYADLIRVYLRPTFGSLAAGKVDTELLERFYGRLLRCRRLCSGAKRARHDCEPLAPNTVRKIHFVVRSALVLGVRWLHDPGLGLLRCQTELGQQGPQPPEGGFGLLAGATHHQDVVGVTDQHSLHPTHTGQDL